MNEATAIFLAFMVAVIGGVTLIIAAMNNRRHLKEMQHRERLAMIQAGLMPSPESDPAGFEKSAGLAAPRRSGRGERYRTAGVIMIGIGLGLIVLIGGAMGEVEVGIGVGGAWVMLGAALLANYFLMRREQRPDSPRAEPRSDGP